MKLEHMASGASGVLAAGGALWAQSEMTAPAMVALLLGVGLAVWTTDDGGLKLRATTGVFNFLAGFFCSALVVDYLSLTHDFAVPAFAFLIGAFGHPAVTAAGRVLMSKLK